MYDATPDHCRLPNPGRYAWRASQVTRLTHSGAYPGQSMNSGGPQCGAQSDVNTAPRPSWYAPQATSGSEPQVTSTSAAGLGVTRLQAARLRPVAGRPG